MDKHELLIKHLKCLLDEAEGYEFHDFRNTKYATPKVDLVRLLLAIVENAKSGEYDN